MRISDWSSDVCSSDLLEKRQGHVGFVPATAVAAGKAPTDAEIATFYSHETARYTVPERRVIRYAVVMPDRVADAAKPSDAEIAQAYSQQKDRFAAKETRTLKQVIVADRAAADALPKTRSEERRVGKEGVRKGRARWCRYIYK